MRKVLTVRATPGEGMLPSTTDGTCDPRGDISGDAIAGTCDPRGDWSGEARRGREGLGDARRGRDGLGDALRPRDAGSGDASREGEGKNRRTV